MTKKIAGLLNSYNRATTTNIYEAYKRPSRRKVNAWTHCKEKCYMMNGHGLKITGHNSSFFSAAFIYEKDGAPHLFYMTHANDYTGPIA